MIIKRECPFCGTISAVSVNTEQYERWRAGALIQTAMPRLSAEDRETLITGMCSACQAKIFGGGDND